MAAEEEIVAPESTAGDLVLCAGEAVVEAVEATEATEADAIEAVEEAEAEAIEAVEAVEADAIAVAHTKVVLTMPCPSHNPEIC